MEEAGPETRAESDPRRLLGLFAWAYIASRRRLFLSFSFRSSERGTEKSPIHQTLTLTHQERSDPAMAVEQMQFAMPVADGSEGFPLIPSVQAEKRKAKEAFTVRAEAAILKAKSKARKEEVTLKARAKAEAEAAVRKAKAEAAKEEGVVKACCSGSDDDDVPYHDSDAEEDGDTIMARIVARWDIFMKEEEAHDPNNKNQVCFAVQRTGDALSHSDDGYEYYLRKFGMVK